MTMRVLLTLLMIAVPSAALAHPGHGPEIGAVAGFLHPLGGLDHVLAMLAVGVFAAVLGGRALWLVPAAFVSMMVAGFWLGATGVALPFVETGIGLSVLAIGMAAALGRSMPVGAAMALVGAFAVFHGHAHGAELPAETGAWTFALGFVGATVLLHLAGIAATLGVARLAGRHGRTLARAAAALIAVSGVGLLAGWF